MRSNELSSSAGQFRTKRAASSSSSSPGGSLDRTISLCFFPPVDVPPVPPVPAGAGKVVGALFFFSPCACGWTAVVRERGRGEGQPRSDERRSATLAKKGARDRSWGGRRRSWKRNHARTRARRGSIETYLPRGLGLNRLRRLRRSTRLLQEFLLPVHRRSPSRSRSRGGHCTDATRISGASRRRSG